jgi:hypothetical protein
MILFSLAVPGGFLQPTSKNNSNVNKASLPAV